MMKTEFTAKGGFLQRDSVEHEEHEKRVVLRIERLPKETVQTCLKRCLTETI